MTYAGLIVATGVASGDYLPGNLFYLPT